MDNVTEQVSKPIQSEKQILKYINIQFTRIYSFSADNFYFIEVIPLCDNISILYIPVLHNNLH
jgi:hypothetical protein